MKLLTVFATRGFWNCFLLFPNPKDYHHEAAGTGATFPVVSRGSFALALASCRIVDDLFRHLKPSSSLCPTPLSNAKFFLNVIGSEQYAL